MAWEWELRDTCQTSVRYAALGDSMLSWSAADGAPTGAADLGDGVGEFSGSSAFDRQMQLTRRIARLFVRAYRGGERVGSSPGGGRGGVGRREQSTPVSKIKSY